MAMGRKKDLQGSRINRRYIALQCTNTMLSCVGSGYAVYFLTENGYTTAATGILLGVFNAIAIIIQPILGRLADKSRTFTWKRQLMIMAAVCGAAMFLAMTSHSKLLIGLMFGVVNLIINAMVPLVSMGGFYYSNRGYQVNYGFARGLGSFASAVMYLIMGSLSRSYGPSSVPAAALAAMAGVIVSLIMLPMFLDAPGPVRNASGLSAERAGRRDGTYREITAAKEEPTDGGEKGFFLAFIRKHKAFTIMVAGCYLIMTFHYIYQVYLIRIVEGAGGNSGTLGIALFLAAALEFPVMAVIPRVMKKVDSRKLIVFSGFAFLVKGVLFLCARSVPMVLAAQCMQIFTFAVIYPASVYYTNLVIEEKDQGTGQGFMGLSVTSGMVTGNILGGVLFDAAGLRLMLLSGMVIAAAGTMLTIYANRFELKNQKTAAVDENTVP